MPAVAAWTMAGDAVAYAMAGMATALSLLPAKWLLASAGCALAGLLCWALLNGIAQMWPALRTRRNIWLAAQCVVAAAALLPFLPRTLHLPPQITLTMPPPAPSLAAAPARGVPATAAAAAPAFAAPAAPAAAAAAPAPAAPAAAAAALAAPAAAAAPAAPAAAAAAAASAAAPARTAAAAEADAPGVTAEEGIAVTLVPSLTVDAAAPLHGAALATPATPAAGVGAVTTATRALPLLSAIWLVIYAAGLALAVTRQMRAWRVWRGLTAVARRLSPAELQAHHAFTEDQCRQIAQGGLTVMRTDAAISPVLIGVLRPALLLPAHLDALSIEQQHMIVSHEIRHWRQRDPLCLAIAATLQTIFWFSPALRWMARQMEWALELQCDQHVLAGRPQRQRKQYAASLLQQWATPTGVAAFNGATITARIRHMQDASLPTLSITAAWLTGAALAAVLAVGVLLQPALAFSESQPGALATAATSEAAIAARPASHRAMDAPAAEAWQAPLDAVRVTSFFGVRRSLPSTPHKGIDFGAAKGTPVTATAAGTVIAAGPIAENDGKYGTTVIIDHGAQRSLYAHLNSVNVRPGQRVQAGQRIGAVGQTGIATGPHLHLEVRQDGHNIDPATMLADLDAHATPRALKARRQQLLSKG